MDNMTEENSFKNSCFALTALCIVFCVIALNIYFLLPAKNTPASEELIADFSDELNSEESIPAFVDYLNEVATTSVNSNIDDGLKLYREPMSRAAVEWFYIHVTGSQDVALAILSEADKNDIPLSLAFALAYTESRYNTRAMNKNSNNTIDRGLFQLNNNSFPALSEEDFFDPAISAKYGMSHLKFCLKTAGNEVSALAMYNAGTTKVRSNRTPQSTLNYIGKIMAYQEMVDKLFADEVSSYFEPRLASGITVAMANKN